MADLKLNNSAYTKFEIKKYVIGQFKSGNTNQFFYNDLSRLFKVSWQDAEIIWDELIRENSVSVDKDINNNPLYVPPGIVFVSELKKFMVPGFKGCFALKSGGAVSVEINGGNVLFLNSKPIAWCNLPGQIMEWGKVLLCSDDSKREYDFENGKLVREIGHGGRRVAGPGKKLGRKSSGLAPKKKVCITISPEILELMKLEPTFDGVSSFIESVLVDHFDDVLKS